MFKKIDKHKSFAVNEENNKKKVKYIDNNIKTKYRKTTFFEKPNNDEKDKNNEEESDSDFLLLHGINRSLSDNLQENKIKKNKKTKSEKYAQPKKKEKILYRCCKKWLKRITSNFKSFFKI